MAKLVFDIETSALPIDRFDPVQQEYLFREAESITDPAARDVRREEIARLLSLWPLTAQVVCIAMLNVDVRYGLLGGGPEGVALIIGIGVVGP